MRPAARDNFGKSSNVSDRFIQDIGCGNVGPFAAFLNCTLARHQTPFSFPSPLPPFFCSLCLQNSTDGSVILETLAQNTRVFPIKVKH